MKPCHKARRIQQRAERRGRPMTKAEAIVAMAADFDLTVQQLLERMPALAHQLERASVSR